MTAETLRDALLDDLGAESREREGHIERRLDAIIAAARAESDALRAAVERDIASCRACADPQGWVAWGPDRGWCAVHEMSGSALAPSPAAPERCAHVWPDTDQPPDRCGKCGAPACPTCGGYGDGCETCHGAGYRAAPEREP